jgi:hypothetical protein
MGRSSGGTAGVVRKAGRVAAGRGDDPVQALHHLSNNIHSLALRLLVLQSSPLPPDARTHLDAAGRLAQQSADLVERIHQILEGQAPPRRPRPASPRPRR